MRLKKKLSAGIDLDLKPVMNLMVVLIPVLLVSSEFARISVIDIKLPEGGVNTSPVKEKGLQDETRKLQLTVILTDSVLTLGSSGGFLPSIYYREFHNYITRDDRSEVTVEFTKDKQPLHPGNKRPLEIGEQHEILLYVCDENRRILNRLYTEHNELLVNNKNESVEKVRKGDTLFTVSEPSRMIVVKDNSRLQLRPLSAYNDLLKYLFKVKERYKGAEDINRITIAAEDKVLYDKLVQVMDKARQALYTDISIARLRV